MKKRVLLIALMMILALYISAQEPESKTQQNIKKVKEALGDKILKSADEVIDRYIEAIGGREAIMAIKTLVVTGRNARLGSDDMPLIRYQKQPSFLKAMRTPDSQNYTLSDGEKTWSVNPNGRTELTAGSVESSSRMPG